MKAKSIAKFIAVFSFTVACSTSFAAEPLPSNYGGTSFAFIESPEPESFRLENSQFGLGLVIHKIRNSAMSKSFSTDMVNAKPAFNAHLRQVLSDRLKQSGLKELPAPVVDWEESGLWKIDYASLKTDADLIINIYVDYAGVRSPNSSTFYEPMLYVNFCVVARKLQNWCVLENVGVYGDGTSKNSDMTYVADPEQRWASSEEVFKSIPSIIQAIKFGGNRIAEDVAKKMQAGAKY